jgi:hypothetical protein
MESGNGEATRLASSVDVCGLRRCPDLKNSLGTFKRWRMIEFESHLGFGVFFVLRTKFELNSPVFIGDFAPTCRGFGFKSR